jgi:hypothetical protein
VAGCLATLGAPEPGLGGAGPADMVDLLERRVCRMENLKVVSVLLRFNLARAGHLEDVLSLLPMFL